MYNSVNSKSSFYYRLFKILPFLLVVLGSAVRFPTHLMAQAITATITDATDDGDCWDGSITLQINGGIPPYEIIWTYPPNGSLVDMGEQLTIDGLTPGDYIVDVTDALCGTASATFAVNCDGFYIDAEIFDGTLGVCDDGSISILPQNGTPPYTYETKFCVYPGVWDPVWTTQVVSGLAGGDYCVTVTDNSGEVSFGGPYELNCPCLEPPEFDAAIGWHCGPDSPASILLTWENVEGFPGDYTAIWYGSGGTTYSGFEWPEVPFPGEYRLFISNGQTCHFWYTYVVPGTNFYLNEIISEYTFEGLGYIEIFTELSPIEGPVYYQWSTGETSSSIYELGEESYSVTISGGNCQIVRTYDMIYEPCIGNLSLSLDLSNAAPCGYGNSGAINIQLTGGTPPYEVYFGKQPYGDNFPTWNDPIITSDASILLNGVDEATVYAISVIDANGSCDDTKIFIPCDCSLFTASFFVNDPCFDYTFQSTKLIWSLQTIGDGYYAEMNYSEHLYYMQFLPSILPFSIDWFNGEQTTFDLVMDLENNGPSSPWIVQNLSGPTEVKIKKSNTPDIFCATLIDPFGCETSYCDNAGEQVGCLGEGFYTLDQILNAFFTNPQPYSSDMSVTVGCLRCDFCGSVGDCEANCIKYAWQYETEQFQQVDDESQDFTSPCTGLKFVCPLDPMDLYTVPSWAFYTEFVDYEAEPIPDELGNCYYPCGCLYPIGTFPNMVLPYWVETKKFVPGAECADITEERECTLIFEEYLEPPQVDPSQCLSLLTCLETGELIEFEAPTYTCVQQNGETCRLMLVCAHTQIAIAILEEVVDCDSDIQCPVINRAFQTPDTLDENSFIADKLHDDSYDIYDSPGKNQIIVYPNPSMTSIIVTLDAIKNGSGSVHIEIISLTGQVLFKTFASAWNGKSKFNISSLSAGVYFVRVRIEAEQSDYMKRFVKI
jgi:Secretion system C-terminal sorting domain